MPYPPVAARLSARPLTGARNDARITGEPKQFKIQEPSDHLLALTALVEELASLVAEKMPGPEAEALRHRAHELASRTH